MGVTLLDVFLTALNYDEAGFFAGRLASWQWMLTRRLTRRLARRWRPLVLRQVTGLQIMVTVFAWIGGVILGYALIYLGNMEGSNFQYSGVNGGFFGAVYFSAAQLATVGTSQLSPNTDFLRALSIVESLNGVILVSLILTFLLGIYDVISSLRALSAQFFSPGSGVGEPIASLKPYFPGGEARSLDSHLESIADTFGSYTDGVRLHHSAYYFQSGRDTFSLPYSIRMMAGIIGGLRWGLPGSNPVTQEPALLPLTVQFEKFEQYMHPLLKWQSTDVPQTVSAGDFAAQLQVETDRAKHARRRWARVQEPGDPWVSRFVQVNDKMAELVGGTPIADVREAYNRYVHWLPFAYRAEQFSAAVSRDLDYQPVYDDPADQAPAAVLAPAPNVATPRGRETGLRAFIGRRVTLIDPGYMRLIAAARALGAAVLAVAVLVGVLSALSLPLMPAAVFGGMLAMFTGAAAAAAGTGQGLKRLGGLLTIVPAMLAIGLSIVVPRDPIPVTVTLALLAFVGVALSRFGRQLGGLGQLLFVSFYFTLLLGLKPAEFLPFSLAALVGVLCSVLVALLPNRGAHARVVRGGVFAFEQRILHSLEPLIDTVSAARWDPDLQRRTRTELRQSHHTAAFLVAQLTADDPDVGLTAQQAQVLRTRVHTAELALANLAVAARSATGAGIPIEVRARLAGALQTVQKHVAGYPADPAWVGAAGHTTGKGSPDDADDADATRSPGGPPNRSAAEALQSPIAPAHWPRPARRVYAAAFELQQASDDLYSARAADLVLRPAGAGQPGAEEVAAPDSTALADENAAERTARESAAFDGTATDDTTTADTAADDTELDAILADGVQAAADGGESGPHHQSAHEGATAGDSGESAAIWRRAIQAALSTGIALGFGSLVSTTHQYWAAMPAYQTIGGSDGETFVKGAQKIVGTIAGATVGFGIAITAGSHPAVLLPVLALCVFASSYFRSTSSPLTSFWQTMMFAQLYEFLGRLSTEAIGVRIVETVIGAVVALLIAAIVLPTHTRTKFAAQAMKLIGSIEDVTGVALDVWRKGQAATDADVAALTRGEQAVAQQQRAVQASAAPLRRASGAFDPAGIETLLSEFWELQYYARHLVRATLRGSPVQAGVTAEQWAQLEAATAQNFAALTAAFDGRTPGPVDPEIGIDELGDGDEPGAVEAALRALARTNQLVALMVGDFVPQSLGFVQRHTLR
ncbi:hypothetical protein AWU67_08555 [Microterricola viridarii]|uniref:Uncharacterized protein n=1 Tax=Microterricola viridarii TaxID=412690 RepID=A0A0X8E4I0_9MICO|nr:hypothetical protein AWU67_08555 [Microterricola viridarii]